MNDTDNQELQDFNYSLISADEILPGLWLGNRAVSQSEEFMRQNNISVIVNATKDIPSKFLGRRFYMRIPVDDPGALSPAHMPHNDDIKYMKAVMPLVVDFILRARSQGKNVLVHCHAGAQRSAIIVAAYLLHRGHARSVPEAIRHVIQKRSIAFFSGQSVNFRAVFD
jgi:protein-tyrosine phosphatase